MKESKIQMAIIKCKMCGGDLVIEPGSTVAECEYCGSRQTVPTADNEKKLTLFARANRLRAGCEFDKAAGVYESIVADFPQEAEAYWGLVLCKYGIEYVDDPATGKKIPTCHRSSFDSVMDDSDFEQALENADTVARRLYREEAKRIEEIRKGIIAVSANEQPYDIFICYKETDENGDRTMDSVLAQDIYDALTDKGYRTFFARISLEDKLGMEYEPYIFAALNSAKIMLAVGTDYEYYHAVWVKNEWSRFLKLMTKDKSKHLIPCFKSIDAYDMPKEFAKLQAQDLGKVGAMQDLLRGIGKLLPKHGKEIVAAPAPTVDASAMVMRGQFALEDGDFVKAAEFFERALDQNPQDGGAYLGKVLAALQLSDVRQIDDYFVNLDGDKDFDRAIRFSDPAMSRTLQDIRERANRKYLIKCVTVGIKKYARKREKEERLELAQKFYICDGVLRKYTGEDERVVIPPCIKCIGENAFEEDVFRGNETITQVVISEGVEIIEKRAFFSCKNLTSVVIPETVRRIEEYAFGQCDNLTSIMIPNGVEKIGDSAFCGCRSLSSINIPDSVKEIGDGAFSGCDQLQEIHLSTDNPNFQVAGTCLIDKRERVLLSGSHFRNVPADSGIHRIANDAFCGSQIITDATIPDGVTAIGDWVFSECENLKSIVIPDSLISIGQYAIPHNPGIRIQVSPENQAFRMQGDCLINRKEKTVEFGFDIQNIPADGVVTGISRGAFAGCDLPEALEIPSCIMYIGDGAFSSCKNLSSVTILGSDVTVGLSGFSHCGNLNSIIFRGDKIQLEEDALAYNRELQSVTFYGDDIQIGKYAFNGCNKLQSVIFFGDHVTIDENAFKFISAEPIIYAYSGSDVGRWAIAHQISTRESDEMIRIKREAELAREREREAQRQQELARQKTLWEESERARLQKEKAELEQELTIRTSIFASFRRKEIRTRLDQITQELRKLTNV